MLSRVSSGLVELPLQYDLCSQGVTRGDVVFGRNADSDVPLNHDSFPLLISRKHAVISLVGRGLCIKDTGSTNGTYVNEQRLQPQQTKQLSEDDVVSFGGSRLIVREGREHSNPFVYKLTGVSEVTNPVNATNLERRAANPDLVAVQSGEQAVDLTRTSSIEAAPLDVVDLTNSPDTQVCSRKQSHTNSTPFRIDSRMQTELWRSCPHRPQSRQLRESRLQHASRATVQHGNRPDSNAVRITEAGHKRARAMPAPAQSAARFLDTSALATAEGSPDTSAKKALENEFECTICREFMVATHSVVPCGHMFCGECLSQWLQKNPSCPKCRAAATGWVKAIAVDNVLESVIEKFMTSEELEERQRRKKSWTANSAQINNKMAHLNRGPPYGPGPHMHRIGVRIDTQAAAEAVHAAMASMPGFAGMMWPGQLYAGHPGLQAYRANQQGRGTAAMGAQGAAARAAAQAAARAAANPPVNYTVAYNGDNHRCLCKNCRNPIASNTLRVGYRDRNQMKWFHLGCLPPDQWRQASIPGRLDGLPSLPSAQQGDVRQYLNP